MSPDTPVPARPGQGRRGELSLLNVLFCLMVVFIHIASQTLTDLDRLSWAYAPVLMVQRLCCIAVPGFFFLSGLKMTLSMPGKSLPAYYLARARRLLFPYLLAAAVHYLVFVQLGWFPFSLPAFAQMTLRGNLAAQFYFIVALVQFTLLAPLLRRLAERYSPSILLPLALAVTQASGPFFGSLAQHFPNSPLPYYSGSVCTNFLFYYLVGCFAGTNYEKFRALLRDHQKLLLPMALCLTCIDQAASVLHYSGRAELPYLESLHLLYYISGILLLSSLPVAAWPNLAGRLLRAVDRASYLIYLYHGLVITLFNLWAPGWGITRFGAQLLLRCAAAYAVSIGGCVLWQTLRAGVTRKIGSKEHKRKLEI